MAPADGCAPCRYKDKSAGGSGAAKPRSPPLTSVVEPGTSDGEAGRRTLEVRRPKPLPRPQSPPGWPVPAHVDACAQGRGRRSGLWWIWCWRAATPSQRIRVPYSCQSWRCPACAPHESHVLFARIQEAITGLDPKGFVFLVLTLDQRGYFDKREHGWRRYRDVKEAYRELGGQGQSFLYRLRRWQRRNGQEPIRNQWFSTVEAHRSGWPHVNLVLYSPELAGYLENERLRRVADGQSDRESTLLGGELLDAAIGAGWGRQSTAERARSSEALAGYVVKIAGTADRTTGELAKLTQLPLAAPPRFRRLRSGKGFLPKRHGTRPGWTGTLVRRQRTPEADLVLPIHQCPPEDLETVASCCEIEESLWNAEREADYHAREKDRRAKSGASTGRLVRYWSGPTELRLHDGNWTARTAVDHAASLGGPGRSGRGPTGATDHHGRGHRLRDGPSHVHP